MKKHKEHSGRHFRLIVIIAVFAIGGGLWIGYGRAATYSATTELENGTISGAAAKFSNTKAAAESAVLFGNNLAAPTNLKALTGGSSIALRWDPTVAIPAKVKQYTIFRNGSKIGVVDPTVFNSNFPEVNHCGYIDSAVTAGQTYSYQVQAQDNLGRISDLSTALAAAQPAASQPVPTFIADTADASDLDGYVRNTVIPFLKIWYPKVAARIAYPDYTANTSIRLKLDKSFKGVAYAETPPPPATAVIHFDPTYVRDNQQDVGAWLHESTHVVQAYANGSTPPGWFVEGLADWSREYVLHDRYPTMPFYNHVYTEGYSQGSYFINWIEQHADKPGFIRAVNISGHHGKYSDNLFTQFTGKTIAQLNSAMIAATYQTGANGAIKFSKFTNKCIDNAMIASDKVFPHAVVNTCKNTPTQRWTPYKYLAIGYSLIKVDTSITNGSSDCIYNNGAMVYTSACVYAPNMSWRQLNNGALESMAFSGMCLSLPLATDADASALVMRPCTGDDTQKLTTL